MRSKKSHGEGSIRPRGNSWQLRYLGETRTLRQADYPTKQAINREFGRWKEELNAKADAGESVTMSQLFDRVLAHHRRNDLSETYIIEKKIEKYLRPRLGHFDARKFGLDQVDEYIDERLQEKTYKGTPTRNATVNRELSIIVSALRQLRPEPRNLQIKKLDEEDGIRQGTVSEDEYQLFLRELEDYQKPVWCFSYYTGVRQGQLLKLRRDWAKDWEKTGMIEVPGRFGGERITKNGKPHNIPIYTDGMRAFLRWTIENGNPACPYLFQREGKRISKQTFYCAMKRAAKRLGLAHVLFHDLRRTAVTNMIAAGNLPDEAMAVSGHVDPSVFKRYNIISNEKAKVKVLQVADRMAAWHASKSSADLDKIWTEKTGASKADFELDGKPN